MNEPSLLGPSNKCLNIKWLSSQSFPNFLKRCLRHCFGNSELVMFSFLGPKSCNRNTLLQACPRSPFKKRGGDGALKKCHPFSSRVPSLVTLFDRKSPPPRKNFARQRQNLPNSPKFCLNFTIKCTNYDFVVDI